MPAQQQQTPVYTVGATEGRSVLQGFAIFRLSGEQTGGAYSVVEHNRSPRALGAPMHTPHRDGEIGALIGDEEVHAGPGTFVLKPRGIAHTFWNARSSPARLVEMVLPAGFERYFDVLVELLRSAGGQPAPVRIAELAGKYSMEMDFASVPALIEKYGVKLGG